MRGINLTLFIFTDEASETTGDASSSSTKSTGLKHRDWAAQVESEQQEDADYIADNLSQSNSLPIDAGRGRRGQRRRNT
jgi:hypothetical protein